VLEGRRVKRMATNAAPVLRRNNKELLEKSGSGRVARAAVES
jgi:hypothetical protein